MVVSDYAENQSETIKMKTIPNTTVSDNRVAIDSIIKSLNSRCGRNLITVGNEAGSKFEVTPSGIPSLDRILTVNNSKSRGILKSDISQIWGPISSGKTALALAFAAQIQKLEKEKYVAFLDIGDSFDEADAVSYGVDLTRILVIKPLNAEEVTMVCNKLFDTPIGEAQPISMLILDGFGAIPTPAKQSKSDMLASLIREVQGLIKPSKAACIITRRQNPNRGAPAAADALINKISKTTMELIKGEDSVLVKLHKNIPGGHLTIDPPETAIITLKDIQPQRKKTK